MTLSGEGRLDRLRATSIASGSLAASRPPARASVSRPPPPPPTSAAAILTISLARTPRATSDGATLAIRSTRSSPGAAEHDRRVAELRLQPVGELEQRLAVDALQRGDQHARAGQRPRRCEQLLDIEGTVAGTALARCAARADATRARRSSTRLRERAPAEPAASAAASLRARRGGASARPPSGR